MIGPIAADDLSSPGPAAVAAFEARHGMKLPDDYRAFLAALYFGAGVLLGSGGVRGVERFCEGPASRPAALPALAGAAGVILVAVGAASARGCLPPHGASVLAVGTARAAFCAAACFALSALFLQFGGDRKGTRDALAADGFAIYLLHYPIVTWLQYGLLAVPLGAIAKGTVVFAAALLASWAAAETLRRLGAPRWTV